MRLKAGYEVEYELGLRFYSKLVRLKVQNTGNKSFPLFLKFLFQTGAIKSKCSKGNAICTLQFLFQTGAIKSLLPIQEAALILMFLFQTGAIKR